MSHTDAPEDAVTFAGLGVRRELVRALAERGITSPFPIQAASLPDALAGRDVLGRGRTGSGKTVAFALPIITRIAEAGRKRHPGRPGALVLVPTRELAVQVAETIESLGAALKLRTMTVFGGVRYTAQLRKLERGVDIVIATPGRLEDLLQQGALTLNGVSVVVVDEADLMADMGFLPPVTRILEQVPDGQRLLYSATLDDAVQVLIDRFLHDPLVHSVDEEQSNTGVTHHLFLVTHENKREVLTELLTRAGRTLLFVRTKTFAEKLAIELSDAGVPALALHGNLRQGARQKNLAAFADGNVGVLVATDIAARGIHVDDIGLVVHVDPPMDPKAFLHRSGRTARAGAEGVVVTLVTRNQNKAVKELMALARIKPVQHVVAPGDPLLAQVRAPRVERRPARGNSIFEPDPDDAPFSDERPTRGRLERETMPRRRSSSHQEGRRPERPQAARGGDRPMWRDVRPDERVGHRRAEGWADFERERDGVGDRTDDARGAGRRREGPGAGRTRTPSGRSPERRRPHQPHERESRDASSAWGREERRPRAWVDRQRAKDDRPRVGDDRPRTGDDRPSRREDSAPKSGQAKNRWTAEDRRRNEESRERGFGYARASSRTHTPKPGKSSKPKPGKSSKPMGRKKR